MTTTPLQWPFYLNSFSNEDIVCWYDDDKGWIDQVNKRRLALPSSPSQSNFRVYCIMIVQIKDENGNHKFVTIDGTNGEPGKLLLTALIDVVLRCCLVVFNLNFSVS